MEEVPLIVAHSTIAEVAWAEVAWEVELEKSATAVQSLNRVATATEVDTQRTAMEWVRWVPVEEVAVEVLATTVDTPRTTTTATTATTVGCLATTEWEEGMEGE